MSVCIKTRWRKGFPLLVMSVWKETQRRGGNPCSSCLCGKKHNGEGGNPSHRFCVERNTMEKGEIPSLRLCGSKHNGEGGNCKGLDFTLCDPLGSHLSHGPDHIRCHL